MLIIVPPFFASDPDFAATPSTCMDESERLHYNSKVGLSLKCVPSISLVVRTGNFLVRVLRRLQKCLRAMRASAFALPVHIFEAYICIVLTSVKDHLCNIFYYHLVLESRAVEPSRVDCISVSFIYSFYTTRICISNCINNVHFIEYSSMPRRARLHSQHLEMGSKKYSCCE